VDTLPRRRDCRARESFAVGALCDSARHGDVHGVRSGNARFGGLYLAAQSNTKREEQVSRLPHPTGSASSPRVWRRAVPVWADALVRQWVRSGWVRAWRRPRLRRRELQVVQRTVRTAPRGGRPM